MKIKIWWWFSGLIRLSKVKYLGLDPLWFNYDLADPELLVVSWIWVQPKVLNLLLISVLPGWYQPQLHGRYPSVLWEQSLCLCTDHSSWPETHLASCRHIFVVHSSGPPSFPTWALHQPRQQWQHLWGAQPLQTHRLLALHAAQTPARWPSDGAHHC